MVRGGHEDHWRLIGKSDCSPNGLIAIAPQKGPGKQEYMETTGI